MVAPVVGGAAQSRELQPGVEVKVEEGWGDAQLLTRFMRHIHDRRAVFSGEQIPTVKIMRVNAGACRGVDFCHVLNPPDSNRMENSILQCLAKK